METPVVLVTGASRGIGRAAALELAKHGCHVIATARSQADLERLQSPQITPMVMDVTNAADRERVVGAILAKWGRLDALVNNAGYGAMLALEDTSAETMRAMMETNVVSPNELARLVLPQMRKRGAGRIVNVASIAGHISIPLMGAYSATKFALRATTLALHNEVRQFGIHACLVEPGVIATNFGTHSLGETKAAIGTVEASAYAGMYERHAASRAERRGKSPTLIARRIRHAVLSDQPKLHYFAPFWDSRMANLAKRVLPDVWINVLLRAYFRPRRTASPPANDATK